MKATHRLRATGGVSSSESDDDVSDVELNESTAEKDMGLSTHSGGLFPQNVTGENNKSTEQYTFSNWVGSYSNAELSKVQLDDSDIGPILKWKIDSSERPNRDIIAAESPATRCLWLQWSQLTVKNKVLYRKNVSNVKSKTYEQLVLPVLLQKEVMKATHYSILSGHLGVKKTVQKL